MISDNEFTAEIKYLFSNMIFQSFSIDDKIEAYVVFYYLISSYRYTNPRAALITVVEISEYGWFYYDLIFTHNLTHTNVSKLLISRVKVFSFYFNYDSNMKWLFTPSTLHSSIIYHKHNTKQFHLFASIHGIIFCS